MPYPKRSADKPKAPAPKLPVPDLTITAGCVGFADEFASTDSYRYYICGVYVEPHPAGGVVAVATDGHRMVVIRDDDGSISAPSVLRFDRKFLADCRRKPDLKVSTKDGIAVLGDKASLGTCEAIDGTFPEWRRVVPTPKKTGCSASFQARYLGSFGPLANWLSSSDQGPLRVSSDDDSGPALVQFMSDRAFGVIMPVRWGGANYGKLPAWMSKPRVRVKASAQMEAA